MANNEYHLTSSVTYTPFTIIPKYLIEQELKDGSLQRVLLQDSESNLSGEIRLIRKSERMLGPVGQFFWQHLTQSFI